MHTEEYFEWLMKEGKHFCIAPWVHLHVTGLGYMAPCMQLFEGPDTKGYGNLNQQSFEQLWQGEKIRKLRLRMLQDRSNANCFKCYQNESIGYFSLRKTFNANFITNKGWVANTDENGYAPDAKPISWDLRFSNRCNLKCRMCFYSASSAWFSDAKALGDIEANATESIINGVQDTSKLLESLDDYIPDLKTIHFAGGEPLLLKENYYILQKLIEKNNLEVNIKYNTNLTILDYNNQDLLKLWSKFKNVSVYISIDAIGEQCEYIRKNCKWDKLLEHIEKIKQIPNIDIIINITVSIFNILNLTKIHRYLVENQIVDVTHICLNLVHGPLYYSIQILPMSLKEKVEEQINEHVEWIQNHHTFQLYNDGYYENTLKQWNTCIEFMKEKDGTYLIPKFIEITKKLDILRNENVLEILPELKQIFEYKHMKE